MKLYANMDTLNYMQLQIGLLVSVFTEFSWKERM